MRAAVNRGVRLYGPDAVCGVPRNRRRGRSHAPQFPTGRVRAWPVDHERGRSGTWRHRVFRLQPKRHHARGRLRGCRERAADDLGWQYPVLDLSRWRPRAYPRLREQLGLRRSGSRMVQFDAALCRGHNDLASQRKPRRAVFGFAVGLGGLGALLLESVQRCASDRSQLELLRHDFRGDEYDWDSEFLGDGYRQSRPPSNRNLVYRRRRDERRAFRTGLGRVRVA